ncbi:MAG: hypothetical protein ACXAAO_01190 [Candidatus Thorarchaeota archaeon]|jgi:hypothetical protein
MVRGSHPVFVKSVDRNRLVENMVRVMLLEPKSSKAPVAVKAGPFDCQTSVFYPWKDGKALTDSLLCAFVDSIGAYMVTKFVKQSAVHFCIEWQ